MGKKLQGAALRAKKRQQAAMEALQEEQAAQVAAAAVVDQPDDELFVLDTTGDIVPHHERATSTHRSKRTVKVLTRKEKLEVERLLKTHSRQELVRMVQQGKALLDKTKHVRTHGARSDRTKKANYDLWGADDNTAAAATTTTTKPRLGSAPAGISPGHTQRKTRRALPAAKPPTGNNSKPATVAVEVAKGGQSYRPDPTLHQQALDEAKRVEARRQQAEEYNNTPISQGLLPETRALLVGDTDSEDDDDASSDEDQNESTTTAATVKRRREKLTRAQRNKHPLTRELPCQFP